jgi:WD40 repeat protein
MELTKRNKLKKKFILLGILSLLVSVFQNHVDAKEEAEILIQTGHTGDVTAVAFSPDGQEVVSGGTDNTLRLWERATGQLVRTFEGHTDNVTAVAFSPDGQQVYRVRFEKTTARSQQRWLCPYFKIQTMETCNIRGLF